MNVHVPGQDVPVCILTHFFFQRLTSFRNRDMLGLSLLLHVLQLLLLSVVTLHINLCVDVDIHMDFVYSAFIVFVTIIYVDDPLKDD